MSYGSSSYYSGKINDLKKEKAKYGEILENLKKVKGNLPTIKEKLELAKKYFANGGYIDESGTLDRGVLEKNYQKIATMLTDIENLIINIQGKIDSLARSISSNEKRLEDAKAAEASQSGE